MQKIWRLLLCLGVVAVTAGYLENKAQASADSLTIKAGFYGGPYYEIASFSDGDMRGMSDGYVWTYSGADSGGFMRLCYAWGVSLDFLLDCAGIDKSSVGYLHMGTEDNYEEYYATFSVNTLLRERYFYPDMVQLADLNGPEEQTLPLGGAAGEGQENPQSVPALLAIGCTEFSRQDYTDAARNGYASYDRSELPEDDKYRLLYGQLGLDSLEAALNVQESDKWVFEINVQLSGAPELVIDRRLVEGKGGETGSRYQVEISVNFPACYGYLSEDILQNLSGQVLEHTQLYYDTSVVNLVQTGAGQYEMEIVGEGETDLEAFYTRQEYDGNIVETSGHMEISGHIPVPDKEEGDSPLKKDNDPPVKKPADENREVNPAADISTPAPVETKTAPYMGIGEENPSEGISELPQTPEESGESAKETDNALQTKHQGAQLTDETPKKAEAQTASQQWMGVDQSVLKGVPAASPSPADVQEDIPARHIAAAALLIFLLGAGEPALEFYIHNTKS